MTISFNSENMTHNEMRKAALLITKASDLELDLSGYGEIGVNPHSGNVYIWCEDCLFTLYIPVSGGDRIYACWSNPETGEEETLDTFGMTAHDLETWAEDLQAQVDEAA